MNEPTNAELKALMESLRSSFESDAKQRSRWEALKDERDGRVLEEVLSLKQRVIAIEGDHNDSKKQIQAAMGEARKAMESFDHLEGFVHDHLKDTVKDLVAEESAKANEPILHMLRQQELNRAAESIAAKRLDEKKKAEAEEAAAAAAKLEKSRDYRLKVLTVAMPLLLAIIGVLQYKFHADTESHLAQQDQRTVQVQRPMVIAPAPTTTQEPSAPASVAPHPR